MKKLLSSIIIGSLLLSTNIYANTEKTEAIKYFENIGKQPDIKNTIAKINDFMGTVETYIVSTGGNPSYSGNQLSLNVSKTKLIEDKALDSNYLESNYNITDNNFYTLVYDKNNLIPVGMKFDLNKISAKNIFTEADKNLLDKTIAYFNSNGIVKDKDGNLIKYFNPTVMSSIKQMYFITKDNSAIKFLDTSIIDPEKVAENEIVYSPDGKGGFLIYQNTVDTLGQRMWRVVGEPEIELTINSTKNLGDVKLPLGGNVTVLNDGGKAIQYTMQSSLDMGAGTSTNVWNKTSGSYEKNYYFNPIKISNISLGQIGAISNNIGSWDSHTTYRNTLIDAIQYEPIYETVKDENGNDILDKDGNPIYQLDEGKQKIVIAQKLNNVIGHIEINDNSQYVYNGRTIHDVYFEIPGEDFNSSKNLNWIGYSYNMDDPSLTGNGGPGCRTNPGGLGSVVSVCLIYISNNGLESNIVYGASTSNVHFIQNYKETGLKIYKVANPFDFANNIKNHYNFEKTKIDLQICRENQIKERKKSDYYLNQYSVDRRCDSLQNNYNHIYPYVRCLYENNCHTRTICHDGIHNCKTTSISYIRDVLKTTPLKLEIGCQDVDPKDPAKPRISVLKPDGNYKLYKVGDKIEVIVKPLPKTANSYEITFVDTGTSFTSNNFNLEYITSDTFGDLQCIKRNANSNYGDNY